ncbi:MAG: SUMF1/EgtB/PvdO family nonheme iron enzyme, partial [Phycisphaerales bacterium]|nr:SUMF1/EgtB/PvdO family nonheme iron enzyme [Phycisphaerales bacterium]
TGPYLIDSSSLQVIMSRIYAGMMSMERQLGRPHGRITAESVFLDATRITPRTRVVLSEPESDDDLRPEEARARDVRALGELIYCLTTRERHAPDRGAPPPDLAAFSRYRRFAGRWHQLCVEMLEVGSAVDLEELRRMRYPQRFPRPDDQPLVQYLGVICAAAALAAGTWYYNAAQADSAPAAPLIPILAPLASPEDSDALACRDCDPGEAREVVVRIVNQGAAEQTRLRALELVDALGGWKEAVTGQGLVDARDAAAAELIAFLEPPPEGDLKVDREALRQAGEQFVAAQSAVASFNEQAAAVLSSLEAITSGDLSVESLVAKLGGTPARMRIGQSERPLDAVVREWHAALVQHPTDGSVAAADHVERVRREVSAASNALTAIKRDFKPNKQDHYLLGGTVFATSHITSGTAGFFDEFRENLAKQLDTPANPFRGLAQKIEDFNNRVAGQIQALRQVEGLSEESRRTVAADIVRLESASVPTSPAEVDEQLWGRADTSQRQEYMRLAESVQSTIAAGDALITEVTGKVDQLALDPKADPRSQLATEIEKLEARVGSATTPASLEMPDKSAVVPEKLSQYDDVAARLMSERAAARSTIEQVKPLLNLDNPSWTVANRERVVESVAGVPKRLVDHASALDSVETDVDGLVPPNPDRKRAQLIAAIGEGGDQGEYAGICREVLELIDETKSLEQSDATDRLNRIEALWLAISRLRSVRTSLAFSDQMDPEAFDEFVRGWITRLGESVRYQEAKDVDGLTEHLLELKELNTLLDLVRVNVSRLTPLEQDLAVTIESNPETLAFRRVITRAQQRLQDLTSRQHFRARLVTFSPGEQLQGLARLAEQIEAWNRDISVKTSNAASWQEGGRQAAWDFARAAYENAGGAWADALKWYPYVDGFLTFERIRMVDLDLDQLQVDRTMHRALREIGARRQMADSIPTGLYQQRVDFFVSQHWKDITQIRNTVGAGDGQSTGALLGQAQDAATFDGRRAGFALAAVDAFAREIEALPDQDPGRDRVDQFRRDFTSVLNSLESPWRTYLGDENRGVLPTLLAIRPSGADPRSGPSGSWQRSNPGPGIVRFVPSTTPAGVNPQDAALEFIELRGTGVYIQRTELSLAQFATILTLGRQSGASDWVDFALNRKQVPLQDDFAARSVVSYGSAGDVRGYVVSSSAEVRPTYTWAWPAEENKDPSLSAWDAVAGWTRHIAFCYPAELGPEWWGAPGTRRWPREAGLALPVHLITFSGATAVAEAAACRLPTSEEWAAAWEQYQGDMGGGATAGRWNSADVTWKRQVDYRARQSGQTQNIPEASSGSFRSDASGTPFSWPPDSATPDDGYLWLRPVGMEPDDAPVTTFKDLAGNVAEWVDTRPGTRTLAELPRGTGFSVEDILVRGSSALSGDLPPDAETRFAAKSGLSRSYTDVGIRLAFDGRVVNTSDRPAALRNAIAVLLTPPGSATP